MKELKILGIVAVISAGMATLLGVGLISDFQSSPVLVPQVQNQNFYVDSYSWNSISTSLDPGERWDVGFSSTYSINVYLMSSSQFSEFQYYGYLDCLQMDSGYSGDIDFTATSTGTYYTVFVNGYSYTASVSLSITTYRYT